MRQAFWLACCPLIPPAWLELCWGDLQLDSRQIASGDIFIALPGATHDGRTFIDQALQQGAIAIIQAGAVNAWHEQRGILYVTVPDLAQRLGALASSYYHYPSQHLQIHAITGTNGKTSCSHFLAQALTLLGFKTAVIGTLGSGQLGQLSPLLNTTPDAVTLQRLLAAFVAQGIRHVTLEASSIALVQGRLQGCHIASAILTNLTRDHLDYHGDMETYGQAKALLFAEPGLQRVILNADDPFHRRCEAVVLPMVTIRHYAVTNSAATLTAQVWPRGVTSSGLSMHLVYQGQRIVLHSALMGAFNVYNVLAVAVTLLDMGVNFADLARLLAPLAPVAGRLQSVTYPDKPLVVVDYAHTPAALAEALDSVRPYVRGVLWCVFGCGGNRDVGKRSQMGKLAASKADKLVLTDDNPRFEASDVILAAIESGIPNGKDYRIIADRKQAIAYAITHADSGDVILLAGKGHENSQQIGAVHHPFDDVLVAKEYLR